MLLGLATAPQVRGQAGPIAHWKFDEPSGPTAFDSAGTNHGALSVAGAMFVPGGISGNAISLDKAANGLVDMGNVLMMGGSNFTVGGWIKTAAGAAPGFGTFVGKHEANTANGYFLSYGPHGDCKRGEQCLFLCRDEDDFGRRLLDRGCSGGHHAGK